MTQAARVTNNIIIELLGSTKADLTAASTYSVDFIAALQDVPAGVGPGYFWDGYSWTFPVNVATDPGLHDTIVAVAAQTALDTAHATITSETSSRRLVEDGLQNQIDDLASLDPLAALTGTGLAAHTSATTWAVRTITGTANEVTITNGSGVAGNPTASLPTALTFTGKTITGGTFVGATFTGESNSYSFGSP